MGTKKPIQSFLVRICISPAPSWYCLFANHCQRCVGPSPPALSKPERAKEREREREREPLILWANKLIGLQQRALYPEDPGQSLD